MNKVMTVYSKEEIAVMPVKDRPLCARISSELYTAVWEAIGAASMCWDPRPGAQVFAAEEASKVAVDLCFKIANEIEDKCQPKGGAPAKYVFYYIPAGFAVCDSEGKFIRWTYNLNEASECPRREDWEAVLQPWGKIAGTILAK